jgi:hypothetical protein
MQTLQRALLPFFTGDVEHCFWGIQGVDKMWRAWKTLQASV